jgi:hypothetical protein
MPGGQMAQVPTEMHLDHPLSVYIKNVTMNAQRNIFGAFSPFGLNISKILKT